MEASFPNQWSGVAGQTLNPSSEGPDVENGDTEAPKDISRMSHENHRKEEPVPPKSAQIPWEDDPANAHNWSRSSRLFHSALPGKTTVNRTTHSLVFMLRLSAGVAFIA